jgi:hypothetical protein
VKATSRDSARLRVLAIAGACCLALFAFAFVAAPHSCDWGLTAYFYAGVALIVAMPAVTYTLLSPNVSYGRTGLALALAAIVCATWIAGLFVANVRILCRLF